MALTLMEAMPDASLVFSLCQRSKGRSIAALAFLRAYARCWSCFHSMYGEIDSDKFGLWKRFSNPPTPTLILHDMEVVLGYYHL